MAVAELGLFGRCEQQYIDGVSCWFDVGHNLPAVQRFVQQLPPCAGTRHLVFGMMVDKPIDAVIGLFYGMTAQWHLAAPQIPPCGADSKTANQLARHGAVSRVRQCGGRYPCSPGRRL